MKTEEEIRQIYNEISEELREADTKEDKLFMYGRLSLLEWVLGGKNGRF